MMYEIFVKSIEGDVDMYVCETDDIDSVIAKIEDDDCNELIDYELISD